MVAVPHGEATESTEGGRLSRDRIVRAALTVLDAEGSAGLTMRRLGREVGCPPMSLYGHIIDKQDVLDAVYELMLSEVTLPDEAASWQQWVRAAYGDWRSVLLRHPQAVAAVVGRRPAVTRDGPFVIVTEAAFRVLTGAGFSLAVAVDVHRSFATFTLGSTVNEIQNSTRRDVLSARSSVVASPTEFPLFIAALDHLLAPDFSASYRFGMELLIEAAERSLERDGGERRTSPR